MSRQWVSVNLLGLLVWSIGAGRAVARAAEETAPASEVTAAPASETATAPAAAPAAVDRPARTARDRFVVVPFVNLGRQRALDFLAAGLPVMLAERLAQHPGLRFAGAPAVLERETLDEALAGAAAGGVKWVVAGRYEKRPDWKIQVTVEIFAAGLPANRVGQAHAVGTKDDVSHTVLAAAMEAFGAAGLAPPAASQRAPLLARFARDPYAFVLFSRGVAAFVGLDGHPGGAERALKIMSRSLRVDPKVPETLRYAGVIHLAAGRPGHARTLWSYAAEQRQDYLAAIAGLAALDRTSGAPSARERYARVLELDPDDLGARRAYGELLSEAGQLDQAQRELETVVAATPGDLRARRALALVLASRHAGVELAAQLAELVRLDPDDLDTRLDLAAALSSIGRVEPALAAYEEVLRRRPRQAAVLKLAADLYRAKGDLARATTCYEKLHRMVPEDPRAVFLLGASYYQAGRLDAAERMFTEGERYPGMLGDAYSNLGAIAIRRGKVKEALWFLSRATQRRAGKAGVRYNYALALRAAQRYQDALYELDAATRSDPNDAEIRFMSGVVALNLGRATEALAHFQEALRIDPAHESARHNVALLQSLKPPAESSYSFAR
jgi:Flp pilus assembly protein TadD/TolB-like protein